MTKLFRNTGVFVAAYLLLMVPTYLLPYLGSNSALVNGTAQALGFSMPPTWWAHWWSLAMLIVITWSRGESIGKHWLGVLPLAAMLFDLAPVLSMIPFVPTVLHLLTLFLGVKSAAPDSDELKLSKQPVYFAVFVTAFAVFGSVKFVSQASDVAQAKAGQAQAEQDALEKLRQGLHPTAPVFQPPAPVQQVPSKPAPVAAPAKPAAPKPVAAPPAPPVVRHIDLSN